MYKRQVFKKDPIDLYEQHNDKSALQRWDVGVACQLGYEFANGIQINAGYKYEMCIRDSPYSSCAETEEPASSRTIVTSVAMSD